MRFVDEFREPGGIARLSTEITRLAQGRHVKLMEVCGGHTHAIYKHGLQDLLPDNVELVHGPGCPVCVIPMGRIDDAIAIARTPGVIFVPLAPCFVIKRNPYCRPCGGTDGWISCRNLNTPDHLDTLKLDNPGVMQLVRFFARPERIVLNQLRYYTQFNIAKPLTYFMRNSHASMRHLVA